MGKNIKYLIAGAVVSLGILAYVGYKCRDMLLLDDMGEDNEGCEGSCSHRSGGCSHCDDAHCHVAEEHVCGGKASCVTACNVENPEECAADAVTEA